jgi:lysophospholipase L1-like esterase
MTRVHRATGARRLMAVCAALASTSAASHALAAAPHGVGPTWVGSWAAAQQVPEPHNALPPEDLTDATLRQVVHLSIGGQELRVRVSNAFGTAPLRITSAHVARARKPGSAAIDPASDHALTFGGHAEVTLPAGAEYWSDPVRMAAPAQADLSVSLHLATAPAQQTSHPGSRATTFLVHGDQTAAADLPGAKTVEHWFNLSGVDVAAAPSAYAVVAFGDSITDGHGATTNGDDRWPDDLARRLLASPATRNVGVLNVGIGGNHVLTDGLGPNAMARLDRDVLAQSRARAVILLEGINDIGGLTRDAPATPEAHAALVQQIETAYAQFVERARAHGVRAIGATILPFAGGAYYHPDAANAADLQALNAWIRTPGHFDAVVDFDAATRDPAHPDRLRPDYDSGDHLHPSPAGYRAMAAAIPLALFAK